MNRLKDKIKRWNSYLGSSNASLEVQYSNLHFNSKQFKPNQQEQFSLSLTLLLGRLSARMGEEKFVLIKYVECNKAQEVWSGGH